MAAPDHLREQIEERVQSRTSQLQQSRIGFGILAAFFAGCLAASESTSAENWIPGALFAVIAIACIAAIIKIGDHIGTVKMYQHSFTHESIAGNKDAIRRNVEELDRLIKEPIGRILLSFWPQIPVKNTLAKIKDGKIPVWVAFWLVHTLPAFGLGFLIAVNAASGFNDGAALKLIYLPYFIFSTVVVIRAVKRAEKPRDWESTFNPNFLRQLAVFVVVLQWLAYLWSLAN